MSQQISTNTFGVAKWIVSTDATQGTHTTIGGALTSASSGDTIFIRTGTYTENLTLKAGVNLCALPSDSSLNQTGNVIIAGNCTLTTAGSVTISGIQLQTNSAALLSVTGSAASIVNLNNCNLNCSNNTGITFSAANTSAAVNLYNCTGNLGTTGIGLFSDSSTGNITFLDCYFTNSGGSTTASTKSAGQFNSINSTFNNPLTYSSSNVASGMEYTNMMVTNTTNLTTSGTGQIAIIYCYFASGTASALSIGTGTLISLAHCLISSSNTNAITGAGSVLSVGTIYTGTSHFSNVTTQTGGAINGITQGTAPSLGMVGEQIRSYIASGSPVTITSTGTTVNITNISVTAGIWDISGLVNFTATSTNSANGACIASIVSTTASTGLLGDNAIETAAPTTTATTGFSSNLTVGIPSFRVTLSATTTYYLTAYGQATVGFGMTAYGRISATRVG